MIAKATPRPATEAQRKDLIAVIVPHSDLAAEYVVLAAMLHHPDLAGPHVSGLHPADWATELHRIMARIGLAHLRSIGRVDCRQLIDVLRDGGAVRPQAFAVELATLARVAELIHTGGIVADAVAGITAHRRGAAA